VFEFAVGSETKVIGSQDKIQSGAELEEAEHPTQWGQQAAKQKLVTEEEAWLPSPLPLAGRQDEGPAVRPTAGDAGRGGAQQPAVAVAGPGVAGNGGGDAAGAAVSAGLIALALRDIAAPLTTAPDALAEAATSAFFEVERAAEALGLPAPRVDEVCCAVEGEARRGAAGCHAFLGMTYRRLRRACNAGNAAAAHAWMDEIVARGAVGQ
jgi:hypothetical protein